MSSLTFWNTLAFNFFSAANLLQTPIPTAAEVACFVGRVEEQGGCDPDYRVWVRPQDPRQIWDRFAGRAFRSAPPLFTDWAKQVRRPGIIFSHPMSIQLAALFVERVGVSGEDGEKMGPQSPFAPLYGILRRGGWGAERYTWPDADLRALLQSPLLAGGVILTSAGDVLPDVRMFLSEALTGFNRWGGGDPVAAKLLEAAKLLLAGENRPPNWEANFADWLMTAVALSYFQRRRILASAQRLASDAMPASPLRSRMFLDSLANRVHNGDFTDEEIEGQFRYV